MKNILFLSIITLLLLQSCKTVKTHKVNEEFEITLENEGVGGYQWHYKNIPEIIMIDSSVVTIEEKGKLAQYEKVYKLKGIKKGCFKLEFHHLRSFEKFDTVPKEHIKIIKIKIKKQNHET